MAATAKERFALINENLQEILNPELIESILEKGDSPCIYWGKHSTRVLYAVAMSRKDIPFFPLYSVQFHFLILQRSTVKHTTTYTSPSMVR